MKRALENVLIGISFLLAITAGGAFSCLMLISIGVRSQGFVSFTYLLGGIAFACSVASTILWIVTFTDLVFKNKAPGGQ